MLPGILPGDVLHVQSRKLTELKSGDVVLYSRQSKLTAHRIVRTLGDQLIARGDSLFEADPPVFSDEVVGQVVSVLRDDRSFRPVLSIGGRFVSWFLRRSDFAIHVVLFCNHLSRNLRGIQLAGYWHQT
jgi:hypothetical protein